MGEGEKSISNIFAILDVTFVKISCMILLFNFRFKKAEAMTLLAMVLCFKNQEAELQEDFS